MAAPQMIISGMVSWKKYFIKKPGAATPGFDCELPPIAGKPTQNILFLHHLPSICKTGGCLVSNFHYMSLV